MSAIRRMENRVRVENPTGGWADEAKPCLVCGEGTHARDREGNFPICQSCTVNDLSMMVDGCNSLLHVQSEGWQL